MDIFRKGELYDEGRLGAPDFSWSDYKTERVRDYALVKLRGRSEQRCEFKKEANEKSAQCFCTLRPRPLYLMARCINDVRETMGTFHMDVFLGGLSKRGSVRCHATGF